MTLSIVLTNHKGGVGKSTSATNIAVGLVQVLRHVKAPNSRVLLIDTDSQGHATLVTTGYNDFGKDDSLYTVLMADRKDASHVLASASSRASGTPICMCCPPHPCWKVQSENSRHGRRALSPLRTAIKIASHYAAIIIDTRPSFSLMTEMGLIAATHAIIPVEPRYLETVGLLSVIDKINEIREGWRHPGLHVSGILVTKMDRRIKGHVTLLEEIQAHSVLGPLVCGVIPQNEAVSYSHHNHLSVFHYDPKAAASKAYAELVGKLVQQLARPKAVEA